VSILFEEVRLNFNDRIKRYKTALELGNQLIKVFYDIHT